MEICHRTTELMLNPDNAASGARSVLEAYGAHVQSKETDEVLKTTYANGNKLHMAHATALLAGSGAVSHLRCRCHAEVGRLGPS